MIKQYIVDAFTDTLFHGNQAAVCLLDEWLPDELLMAITRENRFSETAFLVGHHLRWFTPGGEIDLCGHATLASAFAMLKYVFPKKTEIRFQTLSGELMVKRQKDRYVMTFPAYALTPTPVKKAMEEALGVMPTEAYLGRDLLLVYDDENTIRQITPDQEKLLQLPGLMVHVTSKGKDYDCVSRSFGPKLAIPEDPVCGSGHCHIIPYWASKLHQHDFTAYQASARGGVLYCHAEGQTMTIAGQAVLYAMSDLHINILAK